MIARLAVLTAGVIIGLYTAADPMARRAFWTTHNPWLGTAALLAPGWAMMLSGLVLSRRDRQRRPGVMLALGGFAWFLAAWGEPGAAPSLTFTIGLVIYAATAAVVCHAVLAYRSGSVSRRRSWIALALVAAGYLINIGVEGVLTTLVVEPKAQGCWGCPSNPLLVSHQPQLWASLNWVGIRAGLAWSAAMVLVLLWELASSTPPRRRMIGGTRVAALIFFAAVTARYAFSLDVGFLGAGAYDAQLLTVEAIALVLLSTAVIVDLVKDRQTQRTLTRLVVSLGAAGSGRLRDALADRLRDPDLVIAYPVHGGTYIDAQANAVSLVSTGGKETTRLTYGGSEVAVLVHRRGLLDSPEAVADLVSAIHLGLENERLHAEALAQLAELRSSGARIVAAGDDERRRLERDLHDGAQQRLVGLLLGLRVLQARSAHTMPELGMAQQELRHAIADLRDIAHGIYPAVLQDRGLASGFTALAETSQLHLDQLPEGRLPAMVESTAYLLVARLAAVGPTRVSAAADTDALVVTVRTGGDQPGLSDVADRVRALNGTLDVDSSGHDTLVTLQLPIQTAAITS